MTEKHPFMTQVSSYAWTRRFWFTSVRWQCESFRRKAQPCGKFSTLAFLHDRALGCVTG